MNDKLLIVKPNLYEAKHSADYDELFASLHLLPSFTHNPDKIQAICESRTSNFYLGLIAEHAVAMTTLVKPVDSIEHRTAYIEDVSVSREYRRQGIANTMMDFVIKQAVLLGADRIELHSSNQRKAAHKLYLELGFNFVRTNIMRKEL